jgi:hypothetical protein
LESLLRSVLLDWWWGWLLDFGIGIRIREYFPRVSRVLRLIETGTTAKMQAALPPAEHQAQ